MTWSIQESDQAEADREKALLSVLSRRGPEYATRWHDGLLTAVQALAAFPGPRAWQRVEAEEIVRRTEVRLRRYDGPDRRPTPSVAYYILFTTIDPEPGDDTGTIRILGLVHVSSEAANQYGFRG